MFKLHNSPANAYSKVGVETGVAAADPHALILMLFEGAQLAISTAVGACERKEIEPKGRAISKAVDIVANGLKASLDMSAGGEIAQNLAALYDYMTMRLIQSNAKNDADGMREVSRLLNELRDAWAQIPDVQKRQNQREAVAA